MATDKERQMLFKNKGKDSEVRFGWNLRLLVVALCLSTASDAGCYFPSAWTEMSANLTLFSVCRGGNGMHICLCGWITENVVSHDKLQKNAKLCLW